MATLGNVVGSSLVPNNRDVIEGVLDTFKTERDRQDKFDIAEAKQKAGNRLLPSIALGEEGAEEAMIRLAAINPELAGQMNQLVTSRNKRALLQEKQAAEKGLRDAFFVKGGKSHAERLQRIRRLAEKARIEGRPVDNHLGMSNMSETELDIALDRMIATGLSVDKIADQFTQETFTPVKDAKGNIVGQRSSKTGKVVPDPQAPVKTGPQTDPAKIQDDLDKGRITPEKAEEEFAQLELERQLARKRAATQEKTAEAQLKTAEAKLRDAERGNQLTSAVSEIKTDGTTVAMTNRGKVIVRDPSGRVVEGQERVGVINAANKAEADLARTKAGARKAGSVAIAQSQKFMEQLGGIREKTQLLKDALAQVRAGAGAGPIKSKLPSLRASSQRLDQIQKELGLNVLQNTTFGSLSASELQFALSAALPTNLRPEALAGWIEEKIAAQEKLATYIEDAAIFLGTEGNTVAKWLDTQRELAGGRGGEAFQNVTASPQRAPTPRGVPAPPEGFEVIQ